MPIHWHKIKWLMILTEKTIGYHDSSEHLGWRSFSRTEYGFIFSYSSHFKLPFFIPMDWATLLL